jgi:hypothetical protein
MSRGSDLIAAECLLEAMGRGATESTKRAAREMVGAMVVVGILRELTLLRRTVQAALGAKNG